MFYFETRLLSMKILSCQVDTVSIREIWEISECNQTVTFNDPAYFGDGTKLTVLGKKVKNTKKIY